MYFFSAIVEMINSGLLLDELVHGLFAVPIGIFVWNKTKSYQKLIIYFLVVYLIDMDHWVDYWGYYGMDFNLLKYVQLDYFKYKNTAIVPFHAWEWIVILLLLGNRTKEKLASFYSVVALGMFSHMIWDTLCVDSVIFYSIFWRALNGFIIPS